jgi:NADPH:quinone reductase-like Zn-dependent oxidoreductase
MVGIRPHSGVAKALRSAYFPKGSYILIVVHDNQWCVDRKGFVMNAHTFRAAVVRRPAGPRSIEVVDVPERSLRPGEVRVRIAGASVNPVDLGVAAGVFHDLGLVHQPEHTGLGWDYSGIVMEAAAGVTLAVGTRVAGMVTGFDRDHGTYAEQLVVPAGEVAVVPDDLDLPAASTIPLNGLAGAQIVDLLGDAPAGGERLLVTGAAGAVGGYVATLAGARGWRVTGLARADDEPFVRGLGADFTVHATPGWDAVADAAVLQAAGLALVRDGGHYVGVRPSAAPPTERGITVDALVTRHDTPGLTELLRRAAAGELPVRVYRTMPLEDVAEAHRTLGKGGVRGRIVLVP